jgi:hypothetical protein
LAFQRSFDFGSNREERHMGLGAWILGVVFVAGAACLAFGSKDSADIDNVRSTAGTIGGFALAGDLTGWLVYLAA